MAITQSVTKQFKQDILNGVHQPADVYKGALFTSVATLDNTTTAYAATNEVANGGGYTTGGKTLTGFTVTIVGNAATLTFDDPVWTAATITARGMLIYNSSRSNKALFVLDFGADIVSTNGPFTVDLPAPIYSVD